MTDECETNDTGAGSSQTPALAEDLQRLADRVSAQGLQLIDFITLMIARFAPPTPTAAPDTTATNTTQLKPETPITTLAALEMLTFLVGVVLIFDVVETTPNPTPTPSGSMVGIQLVKDFLRL
ncbi:hypothetical protein Sjap_021793 [Stephania japonica]|uniref:Uncharacterized protein n=1 Tax=Stephania japonica TaxID=461633 RepID=A0AAP0EN40_9MAGN